ncbi:MAG: cation:proton antiporter [Candidatus Micrarchaeota archaeon]|nr:cation:proton antiporter [Candidatus Micrarchaeota archaeon]
MAGQEAEIGALGITILAGVIGRLFLKKTGISDVFLLLLLGILGGMFLQQASVDKLGELMLPLGAVALLFIMMDEGFRLYFPEVGRNLPKALLFTSISFSVAFFSAAAVCIWLGGMELIPALIVAAVFASVAPELVAGFFSALGASESAKAIAEMEVGISDALSVALTLLLVKAAVKGGITLQPESFLADIAFAFLLSCACASLLAALWKAFVSKLAPENEHLVAISLAALLYAGAGMIGANGVVAVFVFSFFVGNSSHEASEGVRKFHGEIAFFLRTLFFIYLGVLLFHSPKPAEVALFALALSLVLAIGRQAAGKIIGFLDRSARKGRLLETMSARGLSSAVLAVIAAGELSHAGISMPIDLPLLALFVIFFTNMITAAMVAKKRKLD